MSRKTTARRGTAAVLAATVLTPGFALGIAEAAASDPVVSGLSKSVVPNSASPGVLTISGKNFTDADLVRLDAGTPIDIADFFVVSPTKIVVKLPSLTAVTSSTTYDVLVRGADGVTLSANNGAKDNLKVSLTPDVDSVSTGVLSALGGAKVTIKGTDLLGTSKVTVGGVEAKVGKVANDAVEVTAPALPVGDDYDVVVTTPVGTSGSTGADLVDYRAAVTKAGPALLDPAGGTMVTVNGAGLLAAASDGDVRFVLKDAKGSDVVDVDVDSDDFLAVSETELVVKAPAVSAFPQVSSKDVVFAGTSVELVVEGSDTTPGAKAVKVQYAPLPSGSISAADSLWALDATPSTREWHNVTITGQNLAGGVVRVNGIVVPTVSSSASTLVFKTVRQGSAVGPWNVTVTTSKGTKTVGTLSYSPDVSVTPTTAVASSAGEELFLAGQGFKALSAASAVSAVINGASAVNLTYSAVSDTLLKVTVPAGTVGHTGTITVTPPTGFGSADTVALSYRGTISITETTAGPTAAGNAVVFSGTGFSALDATGNITYKKDGAAAVTLTYTRTSNTSLSVVFPAGTAADEGVMTLTPPNGYGVADTVAVTYVP